MNKNAWFPLLILVCVGFFWWRWPPHKEPASTAQAVAKPAAPRMKEVRSQAVPIRELHTPKTKKPIPDSCRRQWEGVASESLAQLQDDLRRGAVRFEPECQRFEKTSSLNESVYA